ncbi:hypothetical protein SLA2020_518190 [Shorea laevis]
MKPLVFIFLSLLTATLYFFSLYIDSPSSPSPSLFVIPGRRSMRGLMMSLPEQKEYRNPEMKVMIEDSKQSSIQNPVALDDSDELVYNIDYHGVKTHPTPVPRHPKP